MDEKVQPMKFDLFDTFLFRDDFPSKVGRKWTEIYCQYVSGVISIKSWQEVDEKVHQMKFDLFEIILYCGTILHQKLTGSGRKCTTNEIGSFFYLCNVGGDFHQKLAGSGRKSTANEI